MFAEKTGELCKSSLRDKLYSRLDCDKMSVSISQLSLEHHRSALGIGETEPRISWRFAGDAADWEQTSYDLEITRGETTSSHSADTSDSLYISWPEDPLSSKEQASVRARAHGQDGQESTSWSEWVTVETGLLTEAGWQGAATIAAERETESGEPKRPIHFRKDFNVNGTVESARLYVTALGIYEAEINGERVGDLVLAPGWQSYANRHVYDTYDVTDLITSEGANAIGVSAGEGWYSGRLAWDNMREYWGDTIGVIALLSVTLQDGRVIDVPTDTTWQASTGPVVTSEIYDGEVYDSRIEAEIEGWSSSGFNGSAWLATKELESLHGKLAAPDAPPIRKLHEVKPQNVFQSPSGKTLIDFGQNLVGWLKLSDVQGPSGTNLTLHHAEVLEDGELALRPLRNAKARDTVILHGNGPQSWEPHYTFHGFRYAQIDGWPEGGPSIEEAVTAIVVYTDMEETGHFQSSHDLLNKFHSNVRWSMRGNFLSLPTDCPQRDERLGWTGDAHAFGPTSNFLYNTAGFWRGWHKDVWSEMQRRDSMVVPFFVPTLPLDTNDSPAAYWGDVAVGNPWNLYRSFGDLALLEEQFPQSRGWIDTGVPRNTANNLWDQSGPQFGDWLDPEAPPDNAGGATTHAYLVADAYLVEMTRVLANISTVLGQDDVAQSYLEQHAELRTQFQNTWIQNGEMANRTQTAYALALEFGLYTDETQRAAAAETLRLIIEENEYLVGTGFAGTPALGPALERIGAVEDFYAMLLQTKVPSWLYQVVQNATTTWERWDSLLEDGSVNPGSMTSFNHYAFGAVADWIHGVIGGLRPKEAGWRVAEVRPVPGGGITSAETRYLSGYGEFKVVWSVEEGGEFRLEVTVPPNAKAEVTVPGGESTEVGSGVHQFSKTGFEMPTVGGRRK